jgi:hypothetical protein
VIPGKRYVNWQLPDPKNQPLERVREIRVQVRQTVGAPDSLMTSPSSIDVVPTVALIASP